jgi:DNA-binding NarL/FixJ family response regulator
MSPMTQPIRVLVADDHPKQRDKLVAQLSTQPDFSVVAEAATGLEAVELAALYQPDVVILNLDLPGVDGVEAVRRIVAAYAEARVVVMAAYDNDERIADAMRAGARGHLLRKVTREVLVEAVRAAYRSGPPQPPVIAPSRLLRHLKPEPAPPTPVPGPAAPLTERERQVLGLLVQGRDNEAIAIALGVTERTVKTHVASICARLGAASRDEAIAIARERIRTGAAL